MVLRIEKELHLMEEGCGVHVNRSVFFGSFNMLGNLILSRHLVDPDSEEGSDFYTTMVLARGCTESCDNPDRQTVAAVDAWKHSDFLCKNYILNGLDNSLYNVYSPMVNAKALWKSLERKYKTKDIGSKKFIVGKFLNFKMVDSKTVISQVQEFQLILHDIHVEGMVLGEFFQVAALIEKLPPTWRDFKNYLKHKHKEMKLEDLIVRLRIEEDNRQFKKKASNYHQKAKANVVGQGLFDRSSAGLGKTKKEKKKTEDMKFSCLCNSWSHEITSQGIKYYVLSSPSGMQ
ncbi:hypothetical protein RJ639_016809 [Escallonia herrerae]|uniref:Uncharacterized protein n=1 Tax=Escallonia herrerae TaxID=1293975 RepID=A0AA89ALL0_9ASTE|nr:hypothetical protein RJ639_016809 [Escallonia herrerae]